MIGRRFLGLGPRMGARRTRARAAFAAVVAMAAAVAGPVAPSALAGPACRVTIVGGAAFTALQPAVDAAPAGASLTVKGTCAGATIDRTLTITGIPTARRVAKLDGGGTTRVLRVTAGTLTLQKVYVWHGSAVIPEPPDPDEPIDPTPVADIPLVENAGGGILVEAPGRLVLRDARVLFNKAERGGGIASTGAVTLVGRSSVDHNVADQGGGIWMGPGTTLRMRGTSRLHRNTVTMDGGGARIGAGGRALLSQGASVHLNVAEGQGGGLQLSAARAVLDGSAVIRDNIANAGGGILGEADDLPSSVLLKGASSLRANRTETEAAAIFLEGNLALEGSARITGHDSSALPDQGVIEIRAYSTTFRITMSGDSRIAGNAAGEGGAAIYVIPYCGGSVDLVGVTSARTPGNTPAQLVTAPMERC